MEKGEVYGLLTTVREYPERIHGHVMWECMCKCGKTTIVQKSRLENGHTKSCGCLKVKPIKPRPKTDITGQRFGKLVAEEWVGSKQRGKYKIAVWKCRCDCGNIKEFARTDLLSGRIISCGCGRIKHNGINERLYKIWSSMRDRCNNPNNPAYQWYGGKGVTVSPEWNDYSKFKEWSYSNGYDEKADFGDCTIDRDDVNGNYEPSNCRWVNMEVQANNTSRTVKVEMDGQIKSIKQWCSFLNCNYSTVRSRLKRGVEIKDCFGDKVPYKNIRLI